MTPVHSPPEAADDDGRPPATRCDDGEVSSDAMSSNATSLLQPARPLDQRHLDQRERASSITPVANGAISLA